MKCLASTSDGKDTAVDRAYSGDEAGEVEYTNKFWQKQFWLFKKKPQPLRITTEQEEIGSRDKSEYCSITLDSR